MDYTPELSSQWIAFGLWLLAGLITAGLLMLVVRWILAGIDGRDDDND